MHTDADINAVAAVLIRIYGSGAEAEAARKVNEKRESGDRDAEEAWIRIWDRIAQADLASGSTAA